MIKRFKIFENSLYSSLKNIEEMENNAEWVWRERKYILVDDDKEKFIKKIIGDSEIGCGIEFNNYSDVSLHFKESDFIDLTDENIDDGSIMFALNLTNSYNQYDEYVDDDELDYMTRYLNDENINLIKKLCKLLDVKFKDNQEMLKDLFLSLGSNLDTQDMLNEISYERTNAVEYNAESVLKKLPFTLSSSNSLDIEVEIDIEKIGEYIDKNNLKNINTIKDLLKEIDFSDFSIEKLGNFYESDYVANFKDLDNEFEKQLEELIGILDEPEIEYTDPNQLNLFKDSNDDIIKKSIKHQPKKYDYQPDVFTKLTMKELSYAKDVGGKVLGWFKSYEFQKNFMKGTKLKDYKKLKNEGILHPAIEYEYDYLEGAEKYNL